MKKSKGMQLGAMLAAMLLVAVAFAGIAAPNKEFKNFPKDLPERVLLGLNDSELQDKDIPDFGPEVFEKMKKNPKVIATKGKIPKYATDTERRNWLDKLDKIRIGIWEDMLPYIYPNGTVISSGFNWEGFIYVAFYKNATVNLSHIDRIYEIIDKEAKVRGIQEVPVVFSLGDMPRLDSLVLYNSNNDTPMSENRTITPPANNDTPPIGEASGKSVPGFGLLYGLITLLCVWLSRRKSNI